jgi:hypothetical protein
MGSSLRGNGFSFVPGYGYVSQEMIPHYRREFSMSTKRRMSKLRTASIPSGALIVKRCRYLPCRDTYYLRWMFLPKMFVYSIY